MKTVNTRSKIPKHQQVASIIKHRIQSGKYPLGSNLPPVRMLGGELGVTSNVVQRSLRLLAKEGLVKQQHGIGVTVLANNAKSNTPLRFAFVQPFDTSLPFAGALYCIVEEAFDLKQDTCILKSSRFDPVKERALIEQLMETAIEGLIVWPCPGDKNVEFFKELADKVPLVFVDSKPEDVHSPCVALDYTALGKDIVLYTASHGFSKILILEEPRVLRPFCELFASMHDTVENINASHRFVFREISTTDFVINYPEDIDNLLGDYESKLTEFLDSEEFEAVFCVQETFLDMVLLHSPLASKYPAIKIYTLNAKTASYHKSPIFYKRATRQWQADWSLVFEKAVSVLLDMVYLRNRLKRNFMVKFTGAQPVKTETRSIISEQMPNLQ